MDFSTTITDEQTQTVRISPIDQKGVADSTTQANWSSSDTSVVSIAPAPGDSLYRACVMTGEQPGRADVTVQVGPITHTIHVTVVASPDDSADVSFDPPQAQSDDGGRNVTAGQGSPATTDASGQGGGMQGADPNAPAPQAPVPTTAGTQPPGTDGAVPSGAAGDPNSGVQSSGQPGGPGGTVGQRRG